MNELTTTTNVDDLAVEIVKEHRAVQAAFKQSVEHAIKCGALLKEAKEILPYGDWSDWIANNINFAETTARGYMRLASLSIEERQRVADLSSREALAGIAKVHEKAIADESKTIEGEAEEVAQSETDEEPNRMDDDDGGARAGHDEESGRSPEQKARDIASETIHDVIQRCEWKNVDRLLAFQTLIKLLTEEMKMVIPLSTEESAEARNAAYAAAEQETPAPNEPPTKKRGGGRPKGSKNKPKSEPVSAEVAAPTAPIPDDGLDLRGTFMDRRNETRDSA